MCVYEDMCASVRVTCVCPQVYSIVKFLVSIQRMYIHYSLLHLYISVYIYVIYINKSHRPTYMTVGGHLPMSCFCLYSQLCILCVIHVCICNDMGDTNTHL